MDKIAEFVSSLIPENLPKRRKASLQEELTCHILDKLDYYKELGYSESEGTEKAIADFGTDEKSKSYIYNEFEELYSERIYYGIAAFAVIVLMNFLCFPLDTWVTSADYNRDPDPAGAFVSFSMIFVVLLMILFARIKKYKKTLTAIGAANTLIACSMLVSFYPQMAAYTMNNNLLYLIDRLTPFSVGEWLREGNQDLLGFALFLMILLVPALYCFVEAVRIKIGAAKNIGKPKKRAAAFCASFFVLTLVSCSLLPVSRNYLDNYPFWFSAYANHISEDSEKVYDSISIGDTYEEASKRLKFEGYFSVEPYKESLDKQAKKQFENELKGFEFAKGYEIWFNPDVYISGNGFIGIKQSGGIITAKGVGNMEEKMYKNVKATTFSYNYSNFGYTESLYDRELPDVTEYFESLKKGDSQSEVMSRFGKDLGTIYAKRTSAEFGTVTDYYRVLCFGGECIEGEYEDEYEYKQKDSRYIELTFEDGKLSRGTMYYEVYLEKGTKVVTETVE